MNNLVNFVWGDVLAKDGKNLIWNVSNVEVPKIGSEIVIQAIGSRQKVKNVIYDYTHIDDTNSVTWVWVFF